METRKPEEDEEDGRKPETLIHFKFRISNSSFTPTACKPFHIPAAGG